MSQGLHPDDPAVIGAETRLSQVYLDLWCAVIRRDHERLLARLEIEEDDGQSAGEIGWEFESDDVSQVVHEEEQLEIGGDDGFIWL